MYLTVNFGDLNTLTSQFIQTDAESGSKAASQKQSLFTADKLQSIKAEDLEKTGKDFLKTYKEKIDHIKKDIRTNVPAVQMNISS